MRKLRCFIGGLGLLTLFCVVFNASSPQRDKVIILKTDNAGKAFYIFPDTIHELPNIPEKNKCIEYRITKDSAFFRTKPNTTLKLTLKYK